MFGRACANASWTPAAATSAATSNSRTATVYMGSGLELTVRSQMDNRRVPIDNEKGMSGMENADLQFQRRTVNSRPDPMVARKINREAVVLLGWGRAILLQLSHPLVGAGVAE